MVLQCSNCRVALHDIIVCNHYVIQQRDTEIIGTVCPFYPETREYDEVTSKVLHSDISPFASEFVSSTDEFKDEI